MTITAIKPECPSDLYALYAQILKEKRIPVYNYGRIGYKGKGFRLEQTGDYLTDGKQVDITVDDYEPYFHEKFRVATHKYQSIELDRFIVLCLYEDMRGSKIAWKKTVYQHLKT
jgi:hypothetical protein